MMPIACLGRWAIRYSIIKCRNARRNSYPGLRSPVVCGQTSGLRTSRPERRIGTICSSRRKKYLSLIAPSTSIESLTYAFGEGRRLARLNIPPIYSVEYVNVTIRI